MSKDSAQALHEFWSGFGWKAYETSTVPSEESNPAMPRITYDVITDEFLSPVSMSASLWARSYSWTEISLKAKEIYEGIGLGGVLIPYDDGQIWIKRGHPFSQRMTDEDDAIRRIYINIEAEYFTSK